MVLWGMTPCLEIAFKAGEVNCPLNVPLSSLIAERPARAHSQPASDKALETLAALGRPEPGRRVELWRSHGKDFPGLKSHYRDVFL